MRECAHTQHTAGDNCHVSAAHSHSARPWGSGGGATGKRRAQPALRTRDSSVPVPAACTAPSAPRAAAQLLPCAVPVGRMRADLSDLLPQASEAPASPFSTHWRSPLLHLAHRESNPRSETRLPRAQAARLQAASSQGLPLHHADLSLELGGADSVIARPLVTAHSFGEGSILLLSEPSEPCLFGHSHSFQHRDVTSGSTSGGGWMRDSLLYGVRPG